MPEPLIEIYKFFEDDAKVKAGPNGYKSEKVREFVQYFSENYQLDRVVEYAVYNAFITQFPSIEISKNYFHTICNRKWKTSVDHANITWIEISYSKKMKNRKSKI